MQTKPHTLECGVRGKSIIRNRDFDMNTSNCLRYARSDRRQNRIQLSSRLKKTGFGLSAQEMHPLLRVYGDFDQKSYVLSISMSAPSSVDVDDEKDTIIMVHAFNEDKMNVGD